MLTRFELFVILRNQVSDRTLVRRSLAHEAGMEELARELGADATTWAMVGLGAGLDAELAANNPARRGEVAREVLLAEGGAEEVAEAVRAHVRDAPAEMPAAAAALVVVAALVDGVHGMMGDGDGLDQVDADLVAHKLRRAASRGEEAAVRVTSAAERAGVELPRAAALVLAAMTRIREDLRL